MNSPRYLLGRLLPAIFILVSPPAQAAKNSAPGSEPDRKPSELSESDWEGIRAAHEAYTHEVRAVEGGWEAHNPAQQWRTEFDGRGFVAKPANAGWTWGLELRAYGAGDVRRVATGTPEVKTKGHRLAYHWDKTVQEWFVNDGRGLEHGFSVQERPPGPADAPLTFLLATRGPLTAEVTSDARAVDYRDASGETALTYSGLRVWDADGRELAARFLPAKDGVELQVDAGGARYPLLIDPIAQESVLVPSPRKYSYRFGSAVAMSGNTVLVGSYPDPNGNNVDRKGEAHVFVRSGQSWIQQARLTGLELGAAAFAFGFSVSISGDTIVVGAPNAISGDMSNQDAWSSGAAYVFVRSGTTWTQQAVLRASNTEGSDWFGNAVAVSGDTIVVGAPGEDSNAKGINGNQTNNLAGESGAAYVFVRSGTTWTQQAYVKASNAGAGDEFGNAVALDGNTFVVGASGEDTQPAAFGPASSNNNAPNSGAAYVFVRTGTTWTQQALLKASNAESGDFLGESSVGISGNTIVVSAGGEDSNATAVNGDQTNNDAQNSGAAYVFVRSGTKWTQQAYLKASVGSGFRLLGNTYRNVRSGFETTPIILPVAISGDVVLAGRRIFLRGGTNWSQQDTELKGFFGAVSGTTAIMGEPNDSSEEYGMAIITSGGGGWQEGEEIEPGVAGAVFAYEGQGPSADANLLSLALSGGVLSPVFSSSTLSYALTVPNATVKTTITPRAMQAKAKIEVRTNGGPYVVVPSGKASAAFSLNLGSNTVEVKVTSPDAGTTKTYSAAVTRLGEVNLSALSLSQGTLSPAFAAATTSYTASVAHASDSITVRPRAVNAGASIQVRLNGGPFANVPSDSNSAALPLGLGNNTIDIKVDHGPSTKTYTVFVNRPPSYSSSLSGFNHLIESNVVYSTIGGGWGNTIRTNAIGVAVGGGGSNTAGGFYSTLPGGLQNTTLADYSALSGGRDNFITNRSSGSLIAGGISNTISAEDLTMGIGWFDPAAATVGGGLGNTAGGLHSTVSGGIGNTASNRDAVVSGGNGNTASGVSATVGGGYTNTASGSSATVGGGIGNTASGSGSTVPGGNQNFATNNAFAAGTKAKATNVGTFVWADSHYEDFGSTTNNQFLIRAQGGVGINTNNPGSNALSVNGTVQIGTVQVLTGSGVPTMEAPNGSLYLNTSGDSISTLWIRASGSWRRVRAEADPN